MIATEESIAQKEIKKLRKLHNQNPALHNWVPIQSVTFGGYEGSRGHYMMQVGCACGATMWIDAREIGE